MRVSQKVAIPVVALAVVLTGCANSSSGSGSSSDSSGLADGLTNLPVQSQIDVPADAVKPAGDGKAVCASTTALGYVGAETGANAQLGINIVNGVKLALKEHNAANPNCQVKLKEFDTEGDPTKATGPAVQATNDKTIVGVVGLPFSGESKATGKIFEQAGLAHITPSATNPTLTQNGWTTFFRGLANDNVQGPAAAELAKKLGAKKVFVVQDDSDYGIGLAKTTTDALGSSLLAGTDKVTTGQKDFSATAQKVINSKADAVFYSGYYAEGAPFDQQLVQKGFKGVFIGPDGVKDPQFIKQAGNASTNAYFTCPCIPGDLIPSFATAYKMVSNGQAPGTYSVEGYDATTIMLTAIDKGQSTRAQMKQFIKTYDADGLSKRYKWNAQGELEALPVYGYKVQGSDIVSVGVVSKN
ncbi:branched-chain amino acid ABC transporter substrate-binding protein [Rudaeicoccus suwonensis]|uniref:Amino acid/amide ABC transporter substrate-binding protein (HAAT family) n=1 Tax=Rudaeicoccus suwonensis TaxID=657409 RepID=A0A561EAI0_9MICO|nr:branched-chain amino acid ABC transporter substrate-binding protein [Rudaeicoccus suwonensis]TWE12614.1 amino acid/amide ABC transporter substrate-binding protein (HAAT family) [Rudaeicoccus suwonensis]